MARKKRWNKSENTSQLKEAPNAISFDAYFSKLLRTGKVLTHHKAPMRQYAVQKGIKKEATEETFDKIFKDY